METTPRDELIASLKGAFSGHEIIDIQLHIGAKGVDDFVTQPAVRLSADWALNRDTTGYHWACTHIPTGIAVYTFDTMAKALIGLGAVIALDLPWHMINSAADFKRIMADLPDTVQIAKRSLAIIKKMDGDA